MIADTDTEAGHRSTIRRPIGARIVNPARFAAATEPPDEPYHPAILALVWGSMIAFGLGLVGVVVLAYVHLSR